MNEISDGSSEAKIHEIASPVFQQNTFIESEVFIPIHDFTITVAGIYVLELRVCSIALGLITPEFSFHDI